MSTDTLDMSTLAKDWICGESVCFRADGSRPVTLDFKAARVQAPTSGKILIMQARRGWEELWGVRMLPSGRLLIQPGTEPSRESVYGYPGELALGVSFNPTTGSLSVIVRDGESGPVESFNLTAHTPWAYATEDYNILLGAPEGYADQSPLGWTIDCSFRYGPPAPPEVTSLPVEDLLLTKSLAELAAAFDADPFAPRRVLQGTAQELVHKAAALAESVQDLSGQRPQRMEGGPVMSQATHVNPEEVIGSALAHGQIGRVPWALVERGDGLILAIGSINVPIDTPKEATAAMDLADAIQLYGANIAWGGVP